MEGVWTKACLAEGDEYRRARTLQGASRVNRISKSRRVTDVPAIFAWGTWSRGQQDGQAVGVSLGHVVVCVTSVTNGDMRT